MTDSIDRRRGNLSLDKKTIGMILSIIGVLATIIGIFYGSQVTTAESFSDDRSRITKVETQVINIQARMEQDHSDVMQNNQELNKKIDALLINQGLSPSKISAAK